jgi:hypothetical protein
MSSPGSLVRYGSWDRTASGPGLAATRSVQSTRIRVMHSPQLCGGAGCRTVAVTGVMVSWGICDYLKRDKRGYILTGLIAVPGPDRLAAPDCRNGGPAMRAGERGGAEWRAERMREPVHG